MKDKHDITFMDVRDLLIKINPIAKYVNSDKPGYITIKHGFITANTCKKYDMAVMYNTSPISPFVNTFYNIDFMDIGAIKKNIDSKSPMNDGMIMTTYLDMSEPFDTPSIFTLDKLIVKDDEFGLVEKRVDYSINTTLMEVYVKDVNKFYHKWRSFMFDLMEEFDGGVKDEISSNQ